MKKVLIFISLGILPLTGISRASENGEPVLQEYRNHFKKEYFMVGALMQFVFDFQDERSMPGNNGFSVANARLKLSGEFDGGMGYFLQTKFDNSPALLDAYMSYRISNELTLRMGQFKTPVSAEYLTSASDIDFVNRSRVVSALVPGRQIGVQAGGELVENSFNYALSVSNGNGTGSNNNDNGDFLFAGRLEVFPGFFGEAGAGGLELGLNAAFSRDGDADLAGGELAGFSGDRTLVGFDARATYRRFLLAAEYIRAALEPDTGKEIAPDGFYVTGGYMVRNNLQLLARWERFDLDGLANQNKPSDWIVAGANFWPTGVTELQLNYIVDVDESDLSGNQLLVNAQVVF